MARQLKKRAIEKELKFLADFEVYGVLLFVGLYFATKYVVGMDVGEKPFRLNWVSFYPLLVFSIIVLEGSFYWRNKLNVVRRKKALGALEIGRIYHKLRWLNVHCWRDICRWRLLRLSRRPIYPGESPGAFCTLWR